MKKVGLISRACDLTVLGLIGLIGLIGVVAGGFFIYRGQTAPPHSTPSQLPASSLKLYSLTPDNTLAPPKTIFKAEEPVTFVLTFEKKPTGFWPFVKEARAEDNTQGITTELTFNNGEAKDISVEMKPLEENQFSFSLLRKDPSQLQPGKYQLKVKKEASGQTQTITQDFVWGVLTINTNKAVFTPDGKVYLQMASLDDQGRTLCNSDLKLEITDPQNSLTTLTPQKSPTCGNNNVTDQPDYFAYYQLPATSYQLGTYHLKLTNNSNKYSIEDSFEVKESVPFSVERIGATRINPFKAEYTMNIKVTANQDFAGKAIEQVPSGFVILNQSAVEGEGSSINGEGSSLIAWNINLKSGQTTTLSYTYQAPKISPEIFLLGPLTMKQFNNETIFFSESRQWQIASDAATTTFMESGTDATQGFEFYSSTANSPTSDTTLVKTGPRSIKIDSGPSNVAPYIRRTGVLADAGRRISAYFNFTNIPSTTNIRLFFVRTSAANPIIGIRMTSTGQLQMANGTTQCGTVAGSTLSTGKWYRIAISYTITSTTSFTVKVYLDGVLDMTATGSDCTLANTSSDMLNIGWENAPGANKVFNVDNIYVDNGSDLTDPGDIRVTAKLPASDNTGDFDTAVGASPGAGSRYTNVNERALSITNGWRQNATGQVSENFGIQAISAGDMDLSDQTLVAYGCWIYGAGSATDSGNAQITCNGTGSAINLTTTDTMYVSFVDTATYPTNAATIGMLSTGTTTDTILYEAGIQFAYIPTTISKVKFKGIQMQGVQVK